MERIDVDGLRRALSGQVVGGQLYYHALLVSTMDETRRLAGEGVVALSMTVDGRSGAVLRPPNVASYGFMEMEESGELFERASEMAQATLEQQQERGLEWGRVREGVADSVSKFLYEETRRRPTVLAHIEVVQT